MVKRAWKSFDYTLLLPLLLICTLGIIMVYSSSSIVAITKYAKLHYESDQFFRSQLRNMLVGFSFFILLSSISYSVWRKKAIALVIYSVGLLILTFVLLFGTEGNNSKAWLWGIQPAEFIKVGIILTLARLFAKYHEQPRVKGRSKIGAWGFVFGSICLIQLQPDTGTNLLIFAFVFTMYVCSGILNGRLLKRMCIILICLSPFVYFFGPMLLTTEQQSRIDTFVNPFQDPEDDGFHVINSFIAIASGGLKGLGLGNSIQKYGYLPEPHTDFIMAIVSEELGFVGVAVILIGLALIVVKAFKIAQRCPDPFGSCIAIGIGSMIGIQTIVNVGGVTGMLPLTGVPLPFVSYGGSSLLANLMAMGILANIASYVRELEKQRKQDVAKNVQKPHLVVVK